MTNNSWILGNACFQVTTAKESESKCAFKICNIMVKLSLSCRNKKHIHLLIFAQFHITNMMSCLMV